MEMERELRMWWDKVTLQKYLECGRIPRGLRIHKNPTFGLEDEDFINRWDETLEECSNSLMRLIIQKHSRDRKIR